MAQYAVDERGVSVALACRAFSISQRCFRYVPLLADENEEIEDSLVIPPFMGLFETRVTRPFGIGSVS